MPLRPASPPILAPVPRPPLPCHRHAPAAAVRRPARPPPPLRTHLPPGAPTQCRSCCCHRRGRRRRYCSTNSGRRWRNRGGCSILPVPCWPLCSRPQHSRRSARHAPHHPAASRAPAPTRCKRLLRTPAPAPGLGPWTSSTPDFSCSWSRGSGPARGIGGSPCTGRRWWRRWGRRWRGRYWWRRWCSTPWLWGAAAGPPAAGPATGSGPADGQETRPLSAAAEAAAA